MLAKVISRRQLFFNPPKLVAIVSGCRYYEQQKHQYNQKVIEMSCKVLGVDKNYNLEDIKGVYKDLVQKYHPDSSSGQANIDKFLQVQNAYKTLLSQLIDRDEDIEKLLEDLPLDGFESKVLQHRSQLSTDHHSSVAPDIKKTALKERVEKAVEDALDYDRVRIVDNMTVEVMIQQKSKFSGNQRKTVQSIDRMAEDFIQQSMSEGIFDNLEGSGKPLKREHEGVVDTMDYKLNKIMLASGCAPDWVMLGKEIREDRQFLRNRLNDRADELQKEPHEFKRQLNWKKTVELVKETALKLNESVDKYNMLVPLMKMQTVYFDVGREMRKVEEKYPVVSTLNLDKIGKGTRSTVKQKDTTFFQKLVSALRD